MTIYVIPLLRPDSSPNSKCTYCSVYCLYTTY